MRKKHLEDEDEDEDEGGATYRTVTCAGARAEKAPPAWWAAAVTLGHLESKLFAA